MGFPSESLEGRGQDDEFMARIRRALDEWELSGGEPTSSILGNGAIEVLEARVPKRLGVAHGLAVPSGTLALRTALLAVGVGHDDDVIVPAYDWIASSAAVRSVGAVPVAVDVTLPDCFLDPEAVARAIDTRTRAVVAAHLFGVPGDVPAIREICDQLGIPVIEDVAQAFGAQLDGQPVGSLAAAAAVSFGPGKVLDGGGGGMLVTNREDIWRRAVELSQHPTRQLLAGIPEPNLAVLEARIYPVAALVVLAGLDRLDARLAERRGAIEAVSRIVAGVPGVEIPTDFSRRSCVGPGLLIRVSDRRCLGRMDALGLVVARPARQQLISDGLAIHRVPTPMAERAPKEVVCLIPKNSGGIKRRVDERGKWLQD